MSERQRAQSDMHGTKTVAPKVWSQCGKKAKKVCAASLLNRTVFDEADYAQPAAPVFANNLLRQDVTLHRPKSKCQDLSYSWLLN